MSRPMRRASNRRCVRRPLSKNELPESFMSREAFDRVAGGLRGEDGKFFAMTAYGAVPIPEHMLGNIPKEFIAAPVEEEEEIFVTRETQIVRTTEKDFTHFDHKFQHLSVPFQVERLCPVPETTIIECPHFIYKPVTEEKIIEVPQGVKFIEVPIEVPMAYPPRIVPVPKEMIIERVIETTKPVVQERIVEVPVVQKIRVPKTVKRQVPYVVPRYVERIVEVPYVPGQTLPPVHGAQMDYIPKPPSISGGGGGGPIVPQARVVDDVVHMPPTTDHLTQEIYMSPGIREIKLPYEAKIDISVVTEDEIPPGVPMAQPNVRYLAPSPRGGASPMPTPGTGGQGFGFSPEETQGPMYAGAMDTIVTHEGPGLGHIQYRQRAFPRDNMSVLTQQGILNLHEFEMYGTEILMPPLRPNARVPVKTDGFPDVEKIEGAVYEYKQRPTGQEIIEIIPPTCNPGCGP